MYHKIKIRLVLWRNLLINRVATLACLLIYDKICEIDRIKVFGNEDEGYQYVSFVKENIEEILNLMSRTDPLRYRWLCHNTNNIFITDHFFIKDFSYAIGSKSFYVNLPKEKFDKHGDHLIGVLACYFIESAIVAKILVMRPDAPFFYDEDKLKVSRIINHQMKKFIRKLEINYGKNYNAYRKGPVQFHNGYKNIY